LRKRFYILFVARGEDGQLRKIPIPVHYLYVFVIGAAIGFLSLTGIASSYTRMLQKVAHYNQLRTEQDQLKDRYSRLEQVAKERDIQVASLGSLASEVSALYGLRQNRVTKPALHRSLATAGPAASDGISDQQYSQSLDQLLELRSSAMSGEIMHGLNFTNRFPAGLGSIVNVASVAGLAGIIHRSAYNASKHGLIGLTRTLAAEWGGRGVRVNAVCPGWIKTDMDAVDQGGGAYSDSDIVDRVPLARFARAQDVAEAIAFLADSERNGFINGVSLPVDGGWMADGSWNGLRLRTRT